jgi:tetratricopeptide (TPR) repeat protein
MSDAATPDDPQLDEPTDETSEDEKAGPNPRQFRNPFEGFRLEVDPDAIDESVRNLVQKVRELVDQSRYTKVRISYKGKPLVRDLPMGVFLATEAVTFWYAGLLSALVVNLGARTIIDIEFIHDAAGRVAEGKDFYMSGDVEAAEEKYREALAMKPGDPSALFNLGILLRVTGRRDEAIECLEKAANTKGFEDAGKAQEALDKLKRGARTL